MEDAAIPPPMVALRSEAARLFADEIGAEQLEQALKLKRAANQIALTWKSERRDDIRAAVEAYASDAEMAQDQWLIHT
jgi:hypothetical protein